MPTPIQNYQIPGVYVTQGGSSLTATNATALNVAIIADNPTPSSNTDIFNNIVAVSGANLGQLTVPMVNTTYSGQYTTFSGFTVVWVSGTTTVTGTYGYNFSIVSASGTPFSYLSTSGITATGTNSLPSGSVSVTYGHNWGAAGTYYAYNQAVATMGTAVSGTTIVNPALLGTQLAFQNGANTVQVLPVARIATSGAGAATNTDWARTFSTAGTGGDPTYLATQANGIDVFVPLYGFTSQSGSNFGQVVTPYASNTVAGVIATYLNNTSSSGVYQRAFLGVDGTFNQVTTAAMQALASGFGASGAGTRVSLFYPATVNFNPGLNTSTGLSNVNFNIPGYYLAAAAAGTFVGQTNVATPITNKTLVGFNYIPNQTSLIDAQTNYLPYGIATVYQKRDGNFYILQGLTTNTTNYLTQEISINAIGDQITLDIRNAFLGSNLIGGPLTPKTAGAAMSTVESVLLNEVSSGLIQGYNNLIYTINPATPTTINITFQYSPTYPLNYIQVSLSLNSQTGIVNLSTQQNTLVVN